MVVNGILFSPSRMNDALAPSSLLLVYHRKNCPSGLGSPSSQLPLDGSQKGCTKREDGCVKMRKQVRFR